MDFKDSRLYELLRWIVAGVVGFGCALLFLMALKNEIVSPLSRDKYDHFVTLRENYQQLEEKKEALIASSGYEQIDEIISLEKQHIDLTEKRKAIESSFQKKIDLAYYSLMLFGLLLMLLSMLFAHSIARLLLVATGAATVLLPLLSLPFGDRKLAIISLLFAVVAYMIWYILSKKQSDMRRYLFLQIFGAFSLAYGLFAFDFAIIRYFSPGITIGGYGPREKEMVEPLEKEQEELLMHEQLSKEQKDRYVEIAHELDAIHKEWMAKAHEREEEVAAAIAQMHTGWVEWFMFSSFFAVLCLLIGIFFSAPMLISFGLIIYGSGMLLTCLVALVGRVSPYSFINLLGLFVYGLFAAALLAFAGYRLYHQRRE